MSNGDFCDTVRDDGSHLRRTRAGVDWHQPNGVEHTQQTNSKATFQDSKKAQGIQAAFMHEFIFCSHGLPPHPREKAVLIFCERRLFPGAAVKKKTRCGCELIDCAEQITGRLRATVTPMYVQYLEIFHPGTECVGTREALADVAKEKENNSQNTTVNHKGIPQDLAIVGWNLIDIILEKTLRLREEFLRKIRHGDRIRTSAEQSLDLSKVQTRQRKSHKEAGCTMFDSILGCMITSQLTAICFGPRQSSNLSNNVECVMVEVRRRPFQSFAAACTSVSTGQKVEMGWPARSPLPQGL